MYNEIIMIMTRVKRMQQKAFTLPTVLLSSVIMLGLLGMALQLSTAANNALKEQYYYQLAREAAESGNTRAELCIRDNNYLSPLSGSATIKPNSNCNGSANPGFSKYVVSHGNIRTSYVVSSPVYINGAYIIPTKGKVELVRSDGSVFKEYTYNGTQVSSGQVSFQRIAFGYYQTKGAYFKVVRPDGKAVGVGYNNRGQLGNNSYDSTLTPKPAVLPSGKAVTSVYTNFLSQGRSTFVITSDGEVYGTGSNDFGQLGINSSVGNTNIYKRFQLPAGVSAKFVNTAAYTTFVIGSDNNIYSAGLCVGGQLGSDYPLAGCSNAKTPVRVALPTPIASDLNTLPLVGAGGAQPGNLVADSNVVLALMQGGRVYGWGGNKLGQLGNGTRNDVSKPVQVGEFGNSGKSKAKKLATDGVTSYILDNFGRLYVTGNDVDYWQLNFGALAGAAAPVSNSGNGRCIDVPSSSTTQGTQLQTWNCNSTNAQKLEWLPVASGEGGAIKIRPNGVTELCIDNRSSSSANGNPIQIWACNNSGAQKWVFNNNYIRNPDTGKCISVASNGRLELRDCSGASSQKFALKGIDRVAKVPLPAGRKVVDMTTDQWSVTILLDDGSVWSSGDNEFGQLGVNSPERYSVNLKKVPLPAGVSAKYVYTALFGGTANTFIVSTTGDIYGAGANQFGQLGVGTTYAKSISPVKMFMPAGIKAKTVQTGNGTTVILTDNGFVYTVGNNSHGQLGDGTTNNSYIPKANKYTNMQRTLTY